MKNSRKLKKSETKSRGCAMCTTLEAFFDWRIFFIIGGGKLSFDFSGPYELLITNPDVMIGTKKRKWAAKNGTIGILGFLYCHGGHSSLSIPLSASSSQKHPRRSPNRIVWPGVKLNLKSQKIQKKLRKIEEILLTWKSVALRKSKRLYYPY